jgi:hypothetical protein
MKLFDRAKTKILVVEVEPGRRIPDLDEDSRQAVVSLAHHPGFRYLMAKLKFERAVLQSKLVKERHSDIADVAYLQGGVHWLGWLEDFVRKETQSVLNRHQDASHAEELAFKEAMAAYEEVGKPKI